jgi:hypothetical protein
MEGGCFCRAIRYRVNGPASAVAACHCRKCQYGSGGGPNYVALVPREAFAVVDGMPAEHVSVADSGATVVRAFCARCGTPLYSDTPNLPYRAVRVGSLDDPSDMGPQVHVWMEAAPPWHAVAPGEAVFQRGPGDRA